MVYYNSLIYNKSNVFATKRNYLKYTNKYYESYVTITVWNTW